LKISVSLNSVATQLKCGGIFNNYFIVNCPQYVTTKKFWKLVSIWQRYEKWQRGTFFGAQCISYVGSLHILCDKQSCHVANAIEIVYVTKHFRFQIATSITNNI